MSASESKTQSILTILAELSSRRVTGTLRFEPEPDSEVGLQFLFRKGKLLFATSNYPGERLGEFLVRHGALTEEQASLALLSARQRGRLFHAYLVEEGMVPQARLTELLYQRLEELIDVILRAKDGRFVFRQDLPLEGEEDAPPWVDQELFGRLLQHRNVWPSIFQKLRDPNLVLRCHPGIRGSIAFHNLTEAERKLLSLLDGTHPVSKILANRKNRIDLMIVMSRFLESGLIEVVQPAKPSPRPGVAPGRAEDPAARLMVLDEGPEGPELLFLEKEEPAAPAPPAGRRGERAPEPEPQPPEPAPLIVPAVMPAPAPAHPGENELFDETASLLEALEGPLLDKAADLLERAEDLVPHEEDPPLADEATEIPELEIALMEQAFDDALDTDTDALFRHVDQLVLQAEDEPIEEPDTSALVNQETDPLRPAPAAQTADTASRTPRSLAQTPPGAAPGPRAAPPPQPGETQAPRAGAQPPRAAAPLQISAPPQAELPVSAAEEPVDLDMVPALVPGVRLAELSITGLMMDDLFLISQIDGTSSIRELILITQMPEQNACKVVRRLVERDYIVLQSRTAAPRPRLSLGARNKAAGEKLASQMKLVSSTPQELNPEPPPQQQPSGRRTPVEQADELYKRAISSYGEAQFSRAEELLRASLSLVPRHPLYLARLAVVLLERPGKEREAVRLAEESVDEDPLLGPCQEALAFVRLRFGDVAEARRLMEKAALLDRRKVPSSIAILSAMKSYKPKKGDPPERLWMHLRAHVKLVP